MTFQDAVSIARAEGCKAEIHADRIVITRGGRLIWLKDEALALGPEHVRAAIQQHLPQPAA